jgi:hypothetical protein
MARPEYLFRFAKWLNQVDDAKLDLVYPSVNNTDSARKAHYEMAEKIYMHLLYQ